MAMQLKSNSIDIVNAVRNSLITGGNTEYEQRIPIATRENLRQIGEALQSYQPLANAFLGELINRIAFVIVKSRMYHNPLRVFKKGELGYGTDIEEIFVQVAKAHHYNPAIAEREVDKRELPDVKSAFHRLNRQDFYKVTIQNNDLYNAFLSENGVTDMIARIVNSLYSGDSYDEYLCMKQLVTQYIDNNDTYSVPISPITDESSAKAFLVKVRSWSKNITFMNRNYNPFGVLTHTSIDDMVIFMTPETQAYVDVEALAGAFNLAYADFLQRIVIIDSFGESEQAKETVAVITDMDFYLVYDKLMKFTERYNGEGLYWNYWFHHWQVMSTSKFSNFIRFTTDTISDTTITSITLEPSSASIPLGGYQRFNVEIEGTGNYLKTANFGLSGSLPVYSEVTSEGLVLINTAEPNKTLTLTAQSQTDITKTATASITITGFPIDTQDIIDNTETKETIE